MIYVVGSGPAGVVCAKALLDLGKSVTLIDTGYELESSQKKLVDELSQLPPEQWHSDQIEVLKGSVVATHKGIPKKLLFGSDFSTRDINEYLFEANTNVDVLGSLAKGGLSNIWGSAVLPFGDADMKHWPVKFCDLQRHYDFLEQWLGLSFAHDDLQNLFNTKQSSPDGGLKSSSQTSYFLKDLQSHQHALKAEGFCWGKSRLAVDTNCVYCGLCMYGCPYGYIFNAADKIKELQQNPNFKYQPGFLVEHLLEKNDEVHLHVKNINTGLLEQFVAERVYVAAGAISSVRIILQSLNMVNFPVPLQYSQYFIVPFVRFRATAGVDAERLHTLSQIFLEVQDSKLSPYGMHLQFYSYNDLYPRVFKKMLGPLWFFVRSLIKVFLQRLFIIQGYIHSEHVEPLELSLSEGGKIIIKNPGQSQSEASGLVQKLLKKIGRNQFRLGGFPLRMALKIGQPAAGYHIGGSFPMRANPRALESDIWGRVSGFNRVHVVDASVFPTIPATTITYAAMANAHRIASGWEQYK